MSLVTRLSVLACVTLGISCGSSSVKLSNVGTAMYSRLDTDDTVVYAPRTSARVALGDAAAVDVSYTMDSWTGASIDVRTAATEPIHELRHEVNAGGSYEFDNVTVQASYRHSRENDYWSNGGVVGFTADLFDNNTTIGLSVMGSMDEVGRAGYPWQRQPLNSLGAQATFSQVLDRKTILQVSWETFYFEGLLSSPYRYVAIYDPADVQSSGIPAGTCAVPEPPPEGQPQGPGEPRTGRASLCLPELHPGRRLRQAGWVQLRRALGDRVSLGASYRFYFDDWGLRSHTIWPQLSVLVGDHGTFSMDYRFYTQGAADFYASVYYMPQQDAAPSYYSRDRKMSPMFTNRLGLAYGHDFPFGEYNANSLNAAVRGSVTRYNYLDFVGLDHVDALELSVALSINLD